MIESKFNSWWECDLFLRLQGERLPSLIELQEANLQFGYPINDFGPEISLTRGNYVGSGFVYRSRNENYDTVGRNMQSYYNDGFWSDYLSKYRGIIE